MSFMEYYGKPYLKETRQEQFIRYLNDTGATKALQDALILLYRMPIKPSNLVEFFAEYFENGAKDSVALSLLRAELCYKHSQTQSMHKRIAFLEDQIRQLSPHDSSLLKKSMEGNSVNGIHMNHDEHVPGHENFRLTFEATGDGIQEHMLNRFLDDLDGAARGSIAESTAASSRHSFTRRESDRSFGKFPDEFDENKPAEQGPVEDDSTLSIYSQTGILQGECSKEVEKDAFKNYQEDVRRLDPWGIVCRIPKRSTIGPHKPVESEHKADLFQDLSNPDLLVDLSVISDHRSSAESEIEYKNYDSDDLETLAEIYQNQAVIEEILEIPEDPSKAKILSVLQPSPFSQSNLAGILGWAPISTATDVEETPENRKSSVSQKPPYSFCKAKIDACTAKKVKQCKKRNVFWPFENSYSGESPFKPTADDSFLLKTREGGWGDKVDDSKDFMFEFYQRHRGTEPQEMDKICAKCCNPSRMSMSSDGKRVSMNSRSTKSVKDEQTMTVPADECPCPPGKCDCDFDCKPAKRSQVIIGSPGKMKNWTRYSDAYPDCLPPEDYELGETLGEEFERCIYEHEKRAAKKSMALQQKFNEDFSIPLSPVKSACLCNDSLSDIPREILDKCTKFYKQQEEVEAQDSAPEIEEVENKGSLPDLINHGTMTLGSDEVLRDFIKAKKRKSSQQKEAELAAVFKNPDVYERKGSLGGAGDGEHVAQETKDDQAPRRGTDAYEIDLEQGIRRTLGFN